VRYFFLAFFLAAFFFVPLQQQQQLIFFAMRRSPPFGPCWSPRLRAHAMRFYYKQPTPGAIGS
jgi:hypothetical protein